MWRRSSLVLQAASARGIKPQQQTVFKVEDMAQFVNKGADTNTSSFFLGGDEEVANVTFSSTTERDRNSESQMKSVTDKKDFSSGRNKKKTDVLNPRPRVQPSSSPNASSRAQLFPSKLRKWEFPNCKILPPYRGKIVEYIDPIKASKFAAEWWKSGKLERCFKEESQTSTKVISEKKAQETVEALDDILDEIDRVPALSKEEKKKISKQEAHSARLSDLLGPSVPRATMSPEGRKQNFNYFERQVKELLIRNFLHIEAINTKLRGSSNKSPSSSVDLYNLESMQDLWSQLSAKVLLPLVELFGCPLTLGEVQDLTNLPRSYLGAHLLKVLDHKVGFGRNNTKKMSTEQKAGMDLMVVEINDIHLNDHTELLLVSRSKEFFERTLLPYIPSSMPVPLNALFRCSQWDRSLIAGLELNKQVALQNSPPPAVGAKGNDLSCFLIYICEFVKSGDLKLNLKQGVVQRRDMLSMCPVERLAWACKFTSHGPNHLALLEQGPAEARARRREREVKNQNYRDRAKGFATGSRRDRIPPPR